MVSFVDRTGGRVMPSKIASEIRQARNGLQWIGHEERVELISRIVSELRGLRKKALYRMNADKCMWLDTLIARVSSRLTEIAAMDDMEFQLVLIEFEKLLGVFDAPDHDGQLSPTIH
jgi:hypothetical protein